MAELRDRRRASLEFRPAPVPLPQQPPRRHGLRDGCTVWSGQEVETDAGVVRRVYGWGERIRDGVDGTASDVRRPNTAPDRRPQLDACSAGMADPPWQETGRLIPLSRPIRSNCALCYDNRRSLGHNELAARNLDAGIP